MINLVRSILFCLLCVAMLCACDRVVGKEAGSPAAPLEKLTIPEIVSDPHKERIAQAEGGALYRIGEHLVCVLRGSPHEMGFQHGQLLAKHIAHIYKEGYFSKTLFGKYNQSFLEEHTSRMEKHFPPAYLEEMRGLVEGIKQAGIEGIEYRHVLAAACSAEIQHTDPDAPPGCSNFALFGQWTTDGRLLHGRNLDWRITDQAQEDAVLFVWQPDDGQTFAMPGWAGCIGSVSGMNAQGITIGEMTSSTTDQTFDGIPLLIVTRRVLQEASSLGEAVGILEKGPRTFGWNFVIGDAQIPDARALEVDARTCSVFTPSDPKESSRTGHTALPDAVRRTNHPCGEIMLMKLAELAGEEFKETVWGYEFSFDIDSLAMAVPILKSQETWARYDWLGKQIQGHPKEVDAEMALAILTNGPVRVDNTLHSWVLDPDENTIYLAIAGSDPPVTAVARPYTRIDLSEWFEDSDA